MTAFAKNPAAAIAIGRNEGERLERCLSSLVRQFDQVIYVDSGSSDGSIEYARAQGAEVVELDPSIPFTAARARNAGFEALRSRGLPEFVQFIDADCELDPDWAPTALMALELDPKLGVVCGRRRERFPEVSVYNRLADSEWDTPIGPARACGGDAIYRTAAFEGVNGFNPDLIAGEEPELCLRLARAGWGIERLDAEMTLHDAQMTRFGQWWQRSRRAGFAFAEGAAMYGKDPERHWVAETRRALVWALILPLTVLFFAFFLNPWALLGFLVYPLQVMRLQRSMGWERGLFLTLGKFAEMQGITDYWRKRILGGKQALIEYK
ncbi:glycosyltransferase [Aliiruegeria lutimaris]|uniref:N-terminal domain of galactosyltransferase n=1 Tax=Aliiruegeria lutimaris TaxID=571298 RepID=A0A1G9DUV8_9RHOB|nr:glycosyltransferase family 2 protein [Aliiruegeria lutimaris]SDK67661.1 N-terminal domain of galactosyltransferase [Aliiruegeria lutimaris]